VGAERPLLRNPKFCPEIHGFGGKDGVSGLCGFHFPDEEIFSNPKNGIDEGHGILKMADAILHSKNEAKVTIVATGAQTNIALLLRMFPDVARRVEKIVFMGGAIGLGNSGVAAEFNIEIDPEAAHIVFHSGIPLVMVPLEVTHTILVTDEVLTRIREIGTLKLNEKSQPAQAQAFKDEVNAESVPKNMSPFANCCYKLLSFFKSSYLKEFSFPSPPLHDPSTIFYLTNPEAFDTLNVYVDVEISSKKCLGRTLVDVHGILKKDPNVLVCTRVDSDKFWERMFECLHLANSKSPLNK